VETETEVDLETDLVVDLEADAEEDEETLPEIWKGLEYWKVLGSESS